jgi:hypothetical protein
LHDCFARLKAVCNNNNVWAIGFQGGNRIILFKLYIITSGYDLYNID